MRRILLGIGLSFGSLGAFEGLYFGAGIGGGLSEATQVGEAFGAFIGGFVLQDNFYPIDSQPTLLDHGCVGSLYAGYGFSWSSFYLAVEGLMQWSSASLHALQTNEVLFRNGQQVGFSLTSATDLVIHRLQGGVDLLPGWSPNLATLLYGRIGCGFSRIHLDTIDINNDPSDNELVSIAVSDHQTRANLRVGGGMECRLTRHFSLRADYIYQDYGRLRVEGSNSFVDTPDELTVDRQSRVHLYDHLALLALSYRFSSCEALWDPCCPTVDYCGFYLGVGCGGGALEGAFGGRANGLGVGGSFIEPGPLEALPQDFHNQFQGVAYLGIGTPLERLYLGAEAFITAATDTSLKVKESAFFQNTVSGDVWSTQSSASLSTSTCQYGVDIRPGLFLTPLTLFYARIGVAAAEIKAAPTAQFSGSTTTTWALSTEDHRATWKAAFRFGFGLEQLLTSYLHLRADYVFTDYGRLSFSDFASGLDSGSNFITLTNTFSTHLQNQALLLSLSYYFH